MVIDKQNSNWTVWSDGGWSINTSQLPFLFRIPNSARYLSPRKWQNRPKHVWHAAGRLNNKTNDFIQAMPSSFTAQANAGCGLLDPT